MIHYHNKKFKLVRTTTNGAVSGDILFHYQQQGRLLWCSYRSESILMGHLLGTVDEAGTITMSYHQVDPSGEIMTGTCRSTPEILANGKIRLHEKWQWTSGDESSGESVLEEF
ncbi:hypothetical protein SAMN05192553_10472 [Cyclobacterium xiamenense]|uniref:N-acetylglutamate synthase n=1 Tax=Cyclobacterium xiamenense TaxID=1297121 RepID=A0A1H6YXW6_9BACT|nr:n-acetylglutamate synthase [Cyclobacterium xiamenense]SEJ46089.1 hypothetical protein SAMN05192553_10472 [Cyclobacterium xiamenense]